MNCLRIEKNLQSCGTERHFASLRGKTVCDAQPGCQLRFNRSWLLLSPLIVPVEPEDCAAGGTLAPGAYKQSLMRKRMVSAVCTNTFTSACLKPQYGKRTSKSGQTQTCLCKHFQAPCENNRLVIGWLNVWESKAGLHAVV